jgi:hypothetical protein
MKYLGPAIFTLLAMAALIGWLGADGSPTVSAATPTPTPTPTPVIPSIIHTFTNTTGQAADHLHVSVDLAADGVPLLANAPGCLTPSISTGGFLFTDAHVTWPDPCVDPGESVTLQFFTDCFFCSPPTILSSTWSLTATPTPTPPPDSDSDGVPDASDECPSVPGSSTNGGCPFPPSIGGVAEITTGKSAPISAGPESSTRDHAAPIATAVAAGAVALMAGGWYARRRWLR